MGPDGSRPTPTNDLDARHHKVATRLNAQQRSHAPQQGTEPKRRTRRQTRQGAVPVAEWPEDDLGLSLREAGLGQDRPVTGLGRFIRSGHSDLALDYWACRQ